MSASPLVPLLLLRARGLSWASVSLLAGLDTFPGLARVVDRVVAGVVARVVACPCAFLARVGRPPRWPSELVRHRGIAETFSLEEEVEALARLLEEVVDVVDVEDVVLLLDTGLGREGGREGEREVRGWRLVGVEESTAEGAIVGQTGGLGATGGPQGGRG